MFTLGTDPEFMILDKDGKPVPAWKFFPDKANKVNVDEPYVDPYYKTTYPPQDITAFHDGYAVEINVLPGECRGNLAGYMLKGLKGVMKKLPEGHVLCSLPAVKIDLADMNDAPEDCQIFGCDPSWNAYTGEEDGVALSAATHPYRYAGGHMHISIPTAWKSNTGNFYSKAQWIFDQDNIRLFVKMLDRYVGLPLTAWFAKPETFERRRYYGKAGEFRFQDYGGKWTGVEYRTPGPELWNGPVPASFAFGIMRYIAENFEAVKASWEPALEEKIRTAINTGEGMDELLKKAYLPISGSLNKEEWFERTLKERPFQTLPQEFNAGTTLGHMGWDYYNNKRDIDQPYHLKWEGSYPPPVTPRIVTPREQPVVVEAVL